ncbi:MAG: anaerobic ribonucleoside-triphosphate reductase activating protein [Nanoarchaeota archaeon]|nr:anaerobic ribonucleoside-triphosphate reductase activating protein [Nanoarchaeota archaeon]MCG2717395.1 anaerobic ribonucleoside-triphosphate reductase activating protein [Nanoarchaeota archaeon]
MKIRGFQKTSLIDYPGNISSIIFISGCNFKCPFCYNPEIVNDEGEEISQAFIFEFLDKRKKVLDGVCITGGEPTMHKELPVLIKKIKGKGFKVKLDTNGTNPEMLKELVDKKLVDYIAMDIKSDFENYDEVSGMKVDIGKIKKSIKIIKESNVDYEFRTTLVKEFHDKESIIKICKEIQGSRYFLQNFFNAPKLLSEKNFTPFNKKELEEIKKACSKYVHTVIRES